MSWPSLWAEVVRGRSHRQSSTWCLSVHVRKRSCLVEKRCPRCSWVRPGVGAARTAPVRAPLAGRSERCLVSHRAYCARMQVERVPNWCEARHLPSSPKESLAWPLTVLSGLEQASNASQVLEPCTTDIAMHFSGAISTPQSFVSGSESWVLRTAKHSTSNVKLCGGGDVTPVMRSLTRSIRAASQESG